MKLNIQAYACLLPTVLSADLLPAQPRAEVRLSRPIAIAYKCHVPIFSFGRGNHMVFMVPLERGSVERVRYTSH
jgi:hypothetical protein